MRKETEIVERLYLALDFWKEKSIETFVTCEAARWFLTSRIHKSFSYFSHHLSFQFLVVASLFVCVHSFNWRCQMMCEKLLLSLWGQTLFSFCNLNHPLLSEFRDRACCGNLYGSSSSFSSCRNVGRAFGFNSPFRDFESFVQRELHDGASQMHWTHILILYDAAA